MVCESTRPRVPHETIVSSVFTRKFVDDDCSCEYRKNVVQSIWKRVVRRLVERLSETP